MAKRDLKAVEVFLQAIAQGMNHREAYKKAYPQSKKWKPSSIDSRATALFHLPSSEKRFEEIMDGIREREQKNTDWTRDKAIKTLRGVIDANERERERIRRAYDDQVRILAEKIQEEGDHPLQVQKYVKQLLDLNSKRRISSIHNNGIVTATAELNKMFGYNEMNVNMAEFVRFGGEDKLEE